MAVFSPLELKRLISQLQHTKHSEYKSRQVIEYVLERGGTRAVNQIFGGIRGKIGILATKSRDSITIQDGVDKMVLYAAEIGKPELLKFLLESGKADVHVTQDMKTRCLIQALKGIHTECVELLTTAGADVNGKNFFDIPLFIALEQVQCTKLLIGAGADVNKKDSYGNTCLTNAVHHGKPGAVKVLLEAGADVNLGDMCRHLPLSETATEAHNKCVNLLLEAGADVNQGRQKGATPLCAALMKGHTSCVKLLVATGAHVNLIGTNGMIPLVEAANQGSAECIELLLEAGANVNLASNCGQTPLQVSAARGHVTCVNLLLGAGADVNLANKDREGSTPLCAAARGHTKCVKLLLEAGADVNLTDKYGNSALFEALSWDSFGSVKLLVQAGATLDTTPHCIPSFVRVAAQCCELQCVRMLLDAGLDVNQHFPGRNTLLTEALLLNNIDLIKLLLAKGASIPVCLEHVDLPWESSDPKALVLFAAGEECVSVKHNNGGYIRFLPPDWEDLDLKNQCRKVIRKHLLTLYPNTNLFQSIPKLRLTDERPGLPAKLVSYLVYDQSLNINQDVQDNKEQNKDAP